MSLNRRHFLTLASAAVALPALALGAEPAGRIEVLNGIGIGSYPDARVRIWLPPDYDDGARSFPVLYCGKHRAFVDSESSSQCAIQLICDRKSELGSMIVGGQFRYEFLLLRWNPSRTGQDYLCLRLPGYVSSAGSITHTLPLWYSMRTFVALRR